MEVNPVDPLEASFRRRSGADHVDLVARADERLDLLVQPRVLRVTALPDQTDPRHHATFSCAVAGTDRARSRAAAPGRGMSPRSARRSDGSMARSSRASPP